MDTRASGAKPAKRLTTPCRRTQARLEEIRRFDMPGFRPDPAYIREMQNYGALPLDLGPDDPIDAYATDRAYWKSLWYRPPDTASAAGDRAPAGGER